MGDCIQKALKIVESQELIFNYKTNTNSDFGLTTGYFEERIEDFIDYIVEKGGGDEKIKQECFISLRDANEITTVSEG